MNEHVWYVEYRYTDPIDRYEDENVTLAVCTDLDNVHRIVQDDWDLYNDTGLVWEPIAGTPIDEYALAEGPERTYWYTRVTLNEKIEGDY